MSNKFSAARLKRLAIGAGVLIVVVSGLYTPLHPDDVAWSFDPLMRSPGQETTADGELLALYASALVSDPKAVKAAAATLD